MQVKFEFGYGPLIFDRVILLELEKKKKNSVLFGCMCRFVIEMHRSSSNLVIVRWFLTVILLEQKKIQFPFIFSVRVAHIYMTTS
jgi:hypothetical protein